MHRSHIVAGILIALGFGAVMLLAEPGLPLMPILAVAVGVAALFFLFWLFGTYFPLRRFTPLKQRFGFAASEEQPDLLTGTWQELPVEIQYREAAKGRPPQLSIRLLRERPSLPEIVFRGETALYRLVKSVGLSREQQSGDPIFDRAVYVESERDDVLPPLLASDALRFEILSLFRIRRTEVTVGPDGVGVMILGHLGWRKYFAPEKVQEILERLVAIARHIEAAARSGTGKIKEARPPVCIEGLTFRQRLALLRHPARLAIFIACLLTFVGPALFFWGLRYQPVSWRLHLYTLGLFTISILIYTPLAFSFTRGHSRSHRLFSTFMFAALVGFPTFWLGLLKVTNGLLDRHEPFVVEAEILRRVSKGNRFEVKIDLPDQSGRVSVQTSRQRYLAAKPGEPIPILLFPGALGEPWVVGATTEKISRAGG